MLSRNGQNGENGEFDWKDALIDAGIMAGSTFATAFGALLVTGHIDAYEVGVVVCLAVVQGYRQIICILPEG